VSKRPERLSDAVTSVFVISAADVRRSGATSLAEALRLAPNLQVARAYNQGHTVSARCFNSSAANKLLVLVDGRSVYSPLFSGVFWDVQEAMLEEIDRIEVISGPGSAPWGRQCGQRCDQRHRAFGRQPPGRYRVWDGRSARVACQRPLRCAAGRRQRLAPACDAGRVSRHRNYRR
jgi:hypothetical protein